LELVHRDFAAEHMELLTQNKMRNLRGAVGAQALETKWLGLAGSRNVLTTGAGAQSSSAA
jgi:hypothetical protein